MGVCERACCESPLERCFVRVSTVTLFWIEMYDDMMSILAAACKARTWEYLENALPYIICVGHQSQDCICFHILK